MLDEGNEDAKYPSLVLILVAVEVVLRGAYRLYNVTSPNRNMTNYGLIF